MQENLREYLKPVHGPSCPAAQQNIHPWGHHHHRSPLATRDRLAPWQPPRPAPLGGVHFLHALPKPKVGPNQRAWPQPPLPGCRHNMRWPDRCQPKHASPPAFGTRATPPGRSGARLCPASAAAARQPAPAAALVRTAPPTACAAAAPLAMPQPQPQLHGVHPPQAGPLPRLPLPLRLAPAERALLRWRVQGCPHLPFHWLPLPRVARWPGQC